MLRGGGLRKRYATHVFTIGWFTKETSSSHWII
jgi:hypothetical protein